MTPAVSEEVMKTYIRLMGYKVYTTRVHAYMMDSDDDVVCFRSLGEPFIKHFYEWVKNESGI